jgi:hypothetical protein
MSARGIMPFITGSGGPNVRYARLTASQTFREGEMVTVVDAGTLTECPMDDSEILLSDLDSGLLGGVSAMDGDTTRTDGFARVATRDLIAYYPWNEGTLFITKNFWATGDPDTDVVPAGTDVGESYMVTGQNANDLWGIEQTAGVSGRDVQALIHQVLNVRKEPIAAADTTTGVWLVFELKITVGT